MAALTASDNNADLLALSRRLSRPDLNMSDRASHLDIYNTAVRVAQRRPNPSTAPPLPLLLYAIRNILEPSFLLLQTPELLDLIVHLEIFRLNAADKVQHILRRDQSFRRNNSPPVRLLSDQDRSILRSFISTSQLTATRIIYRKIIHGCCLLHIHHLWANYDPRHPDAPSPLNYLVDYFPAFAQHDPAARNSCQTAFATCSWHYNLSQDELHDNDKVGQEAAQFLVAASQYLDDPDDYCLQKGFQIGESFDTIFPPPSQEETVAAIAKYMRAVTQVAGAIEAIFDDFEG
ncbi:hypothetical protein GSI_05680 [Ganoderma sinense ZZ0214-1]|uniref:Uncharacterized protein n=1 Tax=Ganoderma sinense ZZ0214-1 TaxID=1077348 RepID=A0A2G8SB47_9APHY|nr:hypothetical protein GSI_05680 [Ganoderma sinense ZZ0214-1]